MNVSTGSVWGSMTCTGINVIRCRISHTVLSCICQVHKWEKSYSRPTVMYISSTQVRGPRVDPCGKRREIVSSDDVIIISYHKLKIAV